MPESLVIPEINVETKPHEPKLEATPLDEKIMKINRLIKAWPFVERPFTAKFSLNSTYNEFMERTECYEPPFGLGVHDFYVFGQSLNWGIYMCEYPTIHIIGCTKESKEKFSSAFNLNGNGFSELEKFITMEYNGSKRIELKQKLSDNYKLLE